MKKIALVLFTLLTFLPVSIWAQNNVITIDNVKYEYSGTTAIVIGPANTTLSIITIHKTITVGENTFTVTSIDESAFAYCDGLTSVTIGNSVTSIGKEAFAFCTGLTSIEIPNSVTSIDESAFAYCDGLTSVTIGNSVTSIGDGTFKYCRSLTSVTIPNSVTNIGNEAFYNCSGLTSITIPNSVTSIDESAFAYCDGLTSVTIGNSVTSIGDGAFGACKNLTSITVESGNTNYDSRDGCNAIIATTSNELIAGCKNTVIPNSVTSIGGAAFYKCTGLTSITIPNSVTSIGSSAFQDCNGLISITIPNSVTSIGSSAFSGCDGLTSITIPNSVTSIANFAFAGCKNLTSIEIPNSVTSIGLRAFYNCEAITFITIPNSVTSIGNGAFCECYGLTSIEIPNSVTSIGISAFKNCEALTSITIPNSVTSISGYTFAYCYGMTSIIIPNSVTSIGNNAFYGCTGLISISLPDNVKSIGSSAFSGCDGLTSVTIPNSVTSIGNGAFYGCSGLEMVNFIEPIHTYFTTIPCEAFAHCDNITTILIPEGIVKIERAAFNPSGITTAYLPETTTDIAADAFAEGVTIYKDIKDKEGHVTYSLNLTNKTATAFLTENVATVTVKQTVNDSGINYSVTRINDNIIVDKVTTLNIQGSRWEILDNVDITKMRPTLKIGLGGLWYYHKAKNWGDEDEYFSVGDGSNSGHQNIPEDLRREDIISEIKGIPVTKITGSINLNIKNLRIPSSIIEITGNALTENHLYSFQVDDNNPNYKSDSNGVLFSKDGKTLVSYPADKNSTTYNVPSGVTTIGMCAFGKSTKLTTVNLSSTVTTIEESAFNRLTNLTSFDTKNVKTIGKTAFMASGITSITFGSALETIGTMAFQNCNNLTNIQIPNNIKTIEAQAFNGCTELATITFSEPTHLTTIPANTFSNCDMLSTITIPEGIVTIGNGAFNPSGLNEVYLPTTSSNVHANAFAEDVIINRKLALEFEENDKWATYCSREDLTVPTGLEAFVVTGVEGNSITTEEIEFIPKETPILIQRTDQEPPFWGRSTNQTLPDGLVLDKQFKGTITGISNISSLPGDKYVLKGDEFIKTHTGSLPAFRCYLQIDNGTDAPSSYYITDETSTIIIQEEGVFNKDAGTVTLSRSDYSKMTLTIKPIDVLYADLSSITVKRSINAGSARAPGLNNIEIPVTAVDAKADPSGETKYTFNYTNGWNYEITVNFKKRLDFSKAGTDLTISIEDNKYVYNGKEHKPTDVTVKWQDETLTKDMDYTILGYENNINAGKGKVNIEGKGKYMGRRHGEFDIAQRDINLVTVSPTPIPDQTYKGAAFTAEDLGLKITDINDAITLDDYEITYTDNVNAGKTNQAKIALVAKNINYKNIKDIFFTILPKELTDEAVKAIEPQIYTGKGITPALDIKDGEIPVSDDNYDVTWADNVNVGTATATITFKNNYKGTVITTFEIKDAVLPRQIKNVYEGSAEWATYYSSENLTKPEGLTIYVVTGLEGSTLKTKEINFIPKEVAVLLQRTDKSKFTFDCETMAASTPKPEGINENLFQGTLTGISNINTINGYKYVLVNDQFIQSEEGVLSANRCYINTTTPIDGVLSLIPGKGGNDVILLEEGKENKNAGTVTVSEPKNGKVTISVTPIDVLYAETENISVIRSANARSARAPRVDDSKVIVTAVNPTADPSGTTQYTFDYKEGYNYQVVVDFQKRKDFTKQSSKAEITVVDNQYEYNGTPCKPKNITVKWDGKELTLDKDYEISYDNNINAGKAKVIITGKRTYMATKEATFNIAQRDINLVTVEDIPDQEYTGAPIEPALIIKDIIEEGSESIINEDDYHLEFEDNTEIGKATVKIIANKINYKGMKKVTFNIIPTTGIQQFTVEELEGQWFDLNGQRIQNRPTQKGVYILRDKDGKVKKVRIK